MLDLIKPACTSTDIDGLVRFLTEQGTFAFPALENGLFPAAAFDPAKLRATGYNHVWVRDNIYIALAHHVAGRSNQAIKNTRTLAAFFKKYRTRFESIIRGEVDSQKAMNRPHVRFDGSRLEEIAGRWSHAQNDALGYFLWFFSKLLREGAWLPEQDDLELLACIPLYFESIRYWEDDDSGHWEEERKIEASSIGVVLGGLQMLRLWLREREPASLRFDGRAITVDLLDGLIQKGRGALHNILPRECVQPGKARDYDAALLFLIYPLGVVAGDMAERIVADVRNHLQGPYGIRRYLGDSYWCADYKKLVPPEKRTLDVSENMRQRDALLRKGEEAQWCIFDPILSIIFGEKYRRTGDPQALRDEIVHLNRSLSQLTDENFPGGPYKCPEAYYLEDGRYVPNDHTPLLWAQGNLWMALIHMLQSLQTGEQRP